MTGVVVAGVVNLQWPVAQADPVTLAVVCMSACLGAVVWAPVPVFAGAGPDDCRAGQPGREPEDEPRELLWWRSRLRTFTPSSG